MTSSTNHRCTILCVVFFATVLAAVGGQHPGSASSSEALVVVAENGQVDQVDELPEPPPDFSSNLPVFEPTHEWQEVLEGQHVPGGLHIKLDIAQGKRYAKLMDNEESQPLPAEAAEQNSLLHARSDFPTDKVQNGASPDDMTARAELIDRVLRQLPTPPA